ncbi:MAG: glutathione S-transferase family protein [Pseudomonadota bacterium]
MLTLYGVPHSLYTGRARAYLIKAGIPHREIPANTMHFRNEVQPKAGGKLTLPTIEFEDGRVIRDGAAIIDHFEDETGHPFKPKTPKQNVISLLFDVIGAEGLLRPAMHYRWNFDEENISFLRFHFEMLVPPRPDRKELALKAENQMRGATKAFGVTPDRFALIEALYLDVIKALDLHFTEHPYLLGGRTCIGDFGMYAPLFAHLGRDPKPMRLMQEEAPHLYRWVERMNRTSPDLVEFGDMAPEYLADDALPETLVPVLKTLAEDFVPETLACQAFINHWLAEQEDLAPGTEMQRGLGYASFDVRGKQISALVQPYRFYLLARAQDAFAALDAQAKADLSGVLERAGMSPIMEARLNREIGRADNLEIWL